MTLNELFQIWRQHLTNYPNTDQWFQNNKVKAQVLTLSSWNSGPDQLKQFMTSFNPQQHECYKNAYECATQMPGVSYVEGLGNGKM